MDNRRTLPGYKYYLDAATGERPEVYVAFLNLSPQVESDVNGVVMPVDRKELDSLDLRERNYDRHDVTRHVTEPVGGTVWAYIGSEAGRRRFAIGLRNKTVIVDAGYYDDVRSHFRSLGAQAYKEFVDSTDDPPCPVRQLRRSDL